MRFGPDGSSIPGTHTLGGFTAQQLMRLCHVAGLDQEDATGYAQILVDSLSSVAHRPLALPPPSNSFLSDDHTPVEFSLSFQPGAAPALRVLLEPGCGAVDLAENGRSGLEAVHDMARRWAFSTDQLDKLEDLFFPPRPEGPLSLWCALELRSGGVPKIKVYLNPAANGLENAAGTVREALDRLDHPQAFEKLPPADGYPFFALDLGDWEEPRVKIYLSHEGLSAPDAGRLPRITHRPDSETVEEFLRTAAGLGTALPAAQRAEEPRLEGRPVLSCHSFTDTSIGGAPSGFTLHVPVREYVPDDAQALSRATAVLSRHGMDTTPLSRALPAVTARLPQDGVGLISYLAVIYERSRPPRVTTYISSEAYAVRPPAAGPPSHSHRPDATVPGRQETTQESLTGSGEQDHRV